jgi:hypothetical protein
VASRKAVCWGDRLERLVTVVLDWLEGASAAGKKRAGGRGANLRECLYEFCCFFSTGCYCGMMGETSGATCSKEG